MDEIICYSPCLPIGETQELTFWDILLDDRWAEGELSCADSVYCEIGYLNQKLHAKQNYEFLLRAVQKYPVKAVGCAQTAVQSYDDWEAFRTDCYVVGKYQNVLRENGYFDTIVALLLEQACQMPWKPNGISFLEEMISHSNIYNSIAENTCPFLLYKDTGICCNLLNLFIEKLGEALQKLHQPVIFFDPTLEPPQTLTKYIDQHFKAIIGVQTPFFTIMMQDKHTNLHDLIHGPKFNLIFDHPAWFLEEIKQIPQNYYLMSHDRNYVDFATQHYTNLAGCVHFSPAGLIPTTKPIPMADRIYDLTFIGSYRDYRERLRVIRCYDRKYRHLATHYLKTLKQHPDYTGEQALKETLDYYRIPYDTEKFLEIFYDMRQVYFCILLYYKEKVIQTLLDAEIQVHVFSDSWKNAPFINHPYLVWHPRIDATESLTIMQQSRLSLNIMSWHKDGLTERIFNGMLCHSVVLSDRSTGLEEEFINGEDLQLFSLNELSSLPSLIKELLSDSHRLEQMAQNGYEKALQNHTWAQRATQLLTLLDTK